MKQCFRTAAALFLLVTAPLSAQAAGRIPAATMENLAGDTVAFPKAFAGVPTLVVLAFVHGQQEQVDRGLALLEAAQQKRPTLVWYEFAIINSPPAPIRFFIRNGMRDVIPTARQPHVFPYFVDKEDWLKAAALGNGTEVLLAKVAVDGTIEKTAPLAQFTNAAQILAF